MDLFDKIQDLKTFGINLKLEGLEMEAFYSRTMVAFFNSLRDVKAEPIDDWEFNLFVGGDLTASIIIEDSVLRINPLCDDPYVVVMDLLEFVATKHKETISLYKKISEQDYCISDSSSEDVSDDDEWI